MDGMTLTARIQRTIHICDPEQSGTGDIEEYKAALEDQLIEIGWTVSWKDERDG